MSIFKSMDKHDRILAEIFGEPLGVTITEPIKARIDLDKTAGICPDCGLMPVNGRCGCPADVSGVCPHCGMLPIDGKCGCQPKEMSSSGCGCGGMNQGGCVCEAKKKIKEVTPKGYEKIVKALKKEPDVDNPWAIVQAMKKKGIKPKK